MKRVWRVVNIAAIPLGAWTGYSSPAPEKLTHANPDPLFCFVTFVTIALFVVECLTNRSANSERIDAFASRSPIIASRVL
jgi:hypothetical protein